MTPGKDDRGLQAELERLHALPPAAFIAARNQLAARLKTEGRRDAAAEVTALGRPTPSAWAVTRLMQLEPARFQALLAAGRQAREAQQQVLAAGGGGRAGGTGRDAAPRLRQALAQARELVEELRRQGLALLAAGGRPAAAAVAERLGADLQALAFTAGAEGAIARGWLERDLDPPGFEVLAGLQAAAGPATPSRTGAGTEAGRRSAARPDAGGGAAVAPPPAAPRRLPAESPQRGEREAARQRQEEARRERARAQERQARERDRARLAAAAAAVEEAGAEAARLDDAAAAADRAVAAARRRVAEAEREAEQAHRGAERARQRLARERERLALAQGMAERRLRGVAAAEAADETR